MNTDRIQAMMHDPAVFRQHLMIDTDRGPRRLSETLDPWQTRDFAALDAGWRRAVGQRLEGGCSRAYLERPRGHSKTTDLAVQVLWPIAFAPKQVSGIWAAGDLDQARIGGNAIGVLVRLNPWLRETIDVQANRILNTRTDSALQIISSDSATSFGHLVDFAVIDEVTNWPDSLERLWHSLFSAIAKKRWAVLVLIANAGLGRGTSWQWAVREKARTRPDWYFSALDGPQASWISRTILDEQRDVLPEKVFQRLFLNVWSSDKGDLLRSVDVEAAQCLEGPASGRGLEHDVVICGIDIGLRKDSSAVSVVGGSLSQNRAFLLHTETWRPRDYDGDVPIALVEQHIREVNLAFHPDKFVFDTWQFEGSAQKLANEGLPMGRWASNPAAQDDMARTLLQFFYERRIAIYPDPTLVTDLAKACIIEVASKKLKIVWPRDESGHCDLGVSFTMCLPPVLNPANCRASFDPGVILSSVYDSDFDDGLSDYERWLRD